MIIFIKTSKKQLHFLWNHINQDKKTLILVKNIYKGLKRCLDIKISQLSFKNIKRGTLSDIFSTSMFCEI